MSDINLDEFIANDKILNKILNEKDINSQTIFIANRYDLPGLKEHIAGPYFDAFVTIFEKNVEQESDVKIAAFFRSIPVLATEDGKQKILKYIIPRLAKAIEDLEFIREGLNNNDNLNQLAPPLDRGLNDWVVAALNMLGDSDSVARAQDKIVETALDICDIVKTASPKKEILRYAIFNVIMNHLVNVKNLGTHEARYQNVKTKLNIKRNTIEAKHVLSMILLIILIIIKILA
jgi:hypothetical protein